MDPKNLLLIVSDEHNPKVLGCAGHEEICTPHLDALARSGTRFTNAVCASPICVPTRAALATGHNIFETGYWDNVDAYDGKTPSWHHVLRSAGHEVVSIGKLHYRGWEGDDYGFSQSLLPMHIHGGRGEVKMLLRNPPAALGDGSNMLRSAKAGESDYTHYDGEITKAAATWLRTKGNEVGSQGVEKPWVLMVSLVAPHFPLTVPAEYFDLYSGMPLKMPKGYKFGVDESAHPFLQQYARLSGYNNHFKDESDVRRALAGYYGLISYLDTNVGRVLEALQEAGLADHTRIIYISDHGDNAGARGLWGKSTMYSESVGIPMIVSGPDVAPGRTETTAVSHVDVYNSILDALGHDLSKSTASARGQSVFGPLQPDRVVLSEYHTIGSKSAVFMIQDAETKYVHYCDHRPQLFDLVKDPEEMNDLASTGGHQEQLAIWEARLRELCDPDQADRRAKQRQQELITHYGGEEAIRANVGIGGYSPSPLRNA
ncbi:choline-sulfatase [Variovorax paradoxus]|uniref:sulfatase-like hydrolase/transferase n=1 Tax=Variovorax paradoxus TaxID=34073 RepID=UPI0027827FAE|nr:sulfatase-like hydrolase/transferase [Variovorax paradoxus]MDP9962956.1 choline-sulfatase [Variovorax paradoxus]